jgi:hypothetical protein
LRALRAPLSLYFVLLAISALTIILFQAEAISEVAAEFFGAAGFWAVLLIWLIPCGRDVAPALRRAGPPGWYAASAGLAVCTFALASAVVYVAVEATGAEGISYSKVFLEAGYGWGVVVLLVAVSPAVMEELAFRGVVLSGLQRVLGVRDAVIVSSLMFMVLHLTVLSFPFLFAMGLLLGYLRVRSGSLYPCMLLHFTHNLLVLVGEMAGW